MNNFNFRKSFKCSLGRQKEKKDTAIKGTNMILACEGRMIRCLNKNKKPAVGIYVLQGLDKEEEETK